MVKVQFGALVNHDNHEINHDKVNEVHYLHVITKNRRFVFQGKGRGGKGRGRGNPQEGRPENDPLYRDFFMKNYFIKYNMMIT